MVDHEIWLSFSVTPVQGFITASRTVRDLATSSEILCHLVGAAIDAAWLAGGELLFPSLDPEYRGKRKPHIPNKFIMRGFASKEAADDAEKACRCAAKKAWANLADGVREMLQSTWGSGWDGDWERQIRNYWDIRTFVLEAPADSVAECLLGEPPEPGLRPMWRIAAAVEAASKHVRHFPGGIGRAVPKCTILGDWDQMGPAGSLSEMADFWEKRRGTAIRRIRLGKSDRLCAIALVKRFAGADSKAWGGEAFWDKALAEPFPDTAKVALAHWRKVIEDFGGKPLDALREFDWEVDELSGKAEVYLSADRIVLAGVESLEDEIGDMSGHASERSRIKAARGNLLSAVKDANLPEPRQYYALLKIDADHMGKLLSGDGVEGELDASYYQDLSSGLQSYARRAEKIVKDYCGTPVYVGGDDLLALLPAAQAPACAQALADSFPKQLVKGIRSTVSGGLVIAHYKSNLRMALMEANAVLDAAKESGRNACCVRVLKRSGPPVGAVTSWEILPLMGEISQSLADGASDGWLTTLEVKVLGRLTPSGNACREESLKALLEAFLGHSQGEKKHVHERMQKQVMQLWTNTADFLEGRPSYKGTIQGGPYPDRLRDNPNFGLRLLDDFIGIAHTASFLARGRGSDG